MKKLFRNIRQNLLNEGKTMKYFKYAIGDIVLVVIGILIKLKFTTKTYSSPLGRGLRGGCYDEKGYSLQSRSGCSSKNAKEYYDHR